MKALRLTDAIPIASPSLVWEGRYRRKLSRGKEWAIALTGPDGKEYLLPFKLMKEIAAKDIRLRKLRALREGPVTAESLGVSELHLKQNHYY